MGTKPATDPVPQKRALHLRLSPSALEAVAAEAADEGLTVSEKLRLIVDLHLLRKDDRERILQRIRDVEKRCERLESRVGGTSASA